MNGRHLAAPSRASLPASASALALVLAALAAVLLSGCEKGMHDMYHQPRYDPLAPSPLWSDGGAARLPVPGTQIAARGGFAVSSSGRAGYDLAQRWNRDEYAMANPYPLTAALLARGRERFQIYCAPCHGPIGDGDGYIVRRGFPAPPSYHIDRLRTASDRYLFDVITNGYGLMYSYADRVAPADRWAIVAYIRALQLSQHAPAAQLSAADRAQLDAGRAAASSP
ncbi:MAG TPA: cytochrome c [Steroidobacteraceae bacterium]|nr:cytochrome c [Steroidobacteraceae bacterium]